MKSSIINWSAVSRKLTNDRTRLKASYRGKKYRDIVDIILEKEKEVKVLIEDFKT